jgi:hypothetical protein
MKRFLGLWLVIVGMFGAGLNISHRGLMTAGIVMAVVGLWLVWTGERR